MNEYIEIQGARIHNLKNIDLRIPRGKLTVITGVSGSGKSSLAFDSYMRKADAGISCFPGHSLGWIPDQLSIK